MRSWRSGAALGILAAGASLTAAAARAQTPAPEAQPVAARILVVPFENVAHDRRIVWLGEGSAVLLADDLNALGAGAITREERQEAFEQLQVPPVASLSDATVIRIGEIVGASEVVVGTLTLDGDTLVVEARGIALDTGRIAATVVERGPLTDLFAVIDRVARRIVPSAPPAGGEPARRDPPLPAFEDYIKGLLAETPATELNYLTSALRQAPSFEAARLALWNVYTERDDHARALAVVRAVADTAPEAARAHFLAGLSLTDLERYDEAFAAFKALADRHPTAAVLNNLGVVQLRRGPDARGGQATFYFDQALKADPDDGDACFNLGYAYWIAHDLQASVYWLREAVRRNPADGDAHFVLGVALAASGAAGEASREKELARRLSSTYGDWDKRPADHPLPAGLERLKSDVALPHARRMEAALATSERRDQRDLARFYLDQGRRFFESEQDRAADGALNRAVYLSPYQAEAHLLLGRLHLRNGRPREAIDELKISLWSEETAQAHAALGEAYRQVKDLDAAREEANRALALDPASADAKRLLDELIGR